MYHPQASAMVLEGERQPAKGWACPSSWPGGNIGYSDHAAAGRHHRGHVRPSSLIYLIPPGIIVGLLIYFYAPRMDVDRKSTIDLKTLFSSFASVKGPLTTLVTVVSLRAWVTAWA